MFKLKRPCANCPFKVGCGSTFRLTLSRLLLIFNGPAFQCHKTVEYGEDEVTGLETHGQGEHPQQCAGLMAVLVREKRTNTIMRAGIAFDQLDTAKLDPHGEAYKSIREVIRAHRDGYEPRKRKRSNG